VVYHRRNRLAARVYELELTKIHTLKKIKKNRLYTDNTSSRHWLTSCLQVTGLHYEHCLVRNNVAYTHAMRAVGFN